MPASVRSRRPACERDGSPLVNWRPPDTDRLERTRPKCHRRCADRRTRNSSGLTPRCVLEQSPPASTTTTRRRQNRSRLPSPNRMPTSERAIWLPSIIAEVAIMNSATARISAGLSLPRKPARSRRPRCRPPWQRPSADAVAEQQDALAATRLVGHRIFAQGANHQHLLAEQADDASDLGHAQPHRQHAKLTRRHAAGGQREHRERDNAAGDFEKNRP